MTQALWNNGQCGLNSRHVAWSAPDGTCVTKLDHLIEHLLKRNMRLLNASLDQGLQIYERLAAEICEEELSEVIGLLMDLRDETTSEPDLETLLLSAQTTD